MKKILFFLLSAVICLLVLSQKIYAADDASAKLYQAKCASCHAKDGKGNAAMAKVFKVEASALDLTSKAVAAKKDDELIAVTTAGKGKMPAYKGKLTDADIKGLTGYIRTLAPK